MIVNFILHGLSKTTKQCDVKVITTKIKKNKRIEEIKSYLDTNGTNMNNIDDAAETIIDEFNLETVELPAKIERNEVCVFNLA